jgi:hypothetical protein
MGPIFNAYKIPSCVLCLSFFSSLCWMFISRVITMSLSLGNCCLRPLLCLRLTPGDPIFWLCYCLLYRGPLPLFHIYPVPVVISFVHSTVLCQQF